MNKFTENGLVVLVIGSMIAVELPLQKESQQQFIHAEYAGVSPNININISNMTNSSGALVQTPYDSYTPIEWRTPHDHFVIQTDSLVLPINKKGNG